MATNDDYLRLRRMTGEVGSDTYTDTDLETFIDAAGSLEAAAARIWGEKASAYADLVDITEAGSSRKNSDLFSHAKAQQEYFSGISGDAGGGGTGVPTSAYSTTRRIVRP